MEIYVGFHLHYMKSYTLQFLASIALSVAVFSINILYFSYYHSSYKAIDVAYLNEEVNKEFKIKKTVVSFRKYKELHLTNLHISETNLVWFKLQALSKSKDTINGYYINFKNNTLYQSFVEAIDLCVQNNLDYLLEYNRIWIFHVQTKQRIGEPPFCATNLQR